MQKVAEFEKVSLAQFIEAANNIAGSDVTGYATVIYQDIELPRRATKGSAGYDFYAPYRIQIRPGGNEIIPTGIRIKMDEGWWLGCLPRSGLGFKYQVHLANTMGVIDQDYYYSSNEGHIMIKLINGGDKPIDISRGEAFAQGILLPFGITHSDDADGVRDGGFGSTDTK